MAAGHSYTDLEIRIFALEESGFPVEIALTGAGEFPRGYLNPEPLPWIESASPEADGERLFAWLMADDRLKTAWAQAKGQAPQRRIHLRIDADAAQLHALPWELLREPGQGGQGVDLAAGKATPFSRYLAVGQPHGKSNLQGAVRILVAIAAPEGLERYKLQPVDAEREWSLLRDAVGDLVDVELTRLEGPCTLDALQTRLSEGYHVLHFVGHGGFSSQRGAALFLADTENQVSRASDKELADLFFNLLTDTNPDRGDRLRLIYLSSCSTAQQSERGAFQGLAPKLVAAGAAAVLAMQERIPVVTAQAFAGAFYERLFRHGMADLAANEARAAVMANQMAGASVPVLFMRVANGLILERSDKEQTMDARAKNWWELLPGLSNPIESDGATGDVIIAQIGSGAKNVAVGKNISQNIQEILGEPEPDDKEVIQMQFTLLRSTLAGLESRVDAGKLQMADFQVQLLEGELTKTDDDLVPSASTITQIGSWLLDNLPELTQAITALFGTPAVGRVIGRADDSAMTWAKQRFA